MRSASLASILLCLLVGALGGAACWFMGVASFVTGVVLGAAYGALFALLGGARAASPGAGLVWGLGYAFLLWLAIPAGILPVTMGGMPEMGMLEAARAHFAELVAYVLCFGLPLGVALGTLGAIQNQKSKIENPFSWPRALVVGGWAFGKWME